MRTAQLLILGNGFDLHCGLKSSYNDFFRCTILDPIGEQSGLQQMKAGVSGFWETLLFGYYKINNGNTDYNWCDIEAIIKDTLLTIGGHGKSFALSALEAVKRMEDPLYVTGDDPIKNFLYQRCMTIYYNLNKKETYSDDVIYSLLIDRLLQELYAFERRFCKYIYDELNKKEISDSYIVNAINLLKILTGFTDKQYNTINDIILRTETTYEQRKGFQKTYILSQEFDNLNSTNILSFNYTSLFDILQESPCLYNNVHGKLCMHQCAENCPDCNIIFGIDDTVIQSQDNASELYKFSKTYRKMLSSDTGTHILPSKDNQLIEIKFYGHSLNESDYSYFQSIFDYYNIYENNNVSLIFYYSKGYEQTDKIYQLINAYGKTLSNKDQGKNLTHKLLLENRLKIAEIHLIK